MKSPLLLAAVLLTSCSALSSKSPGLAGSRWTCVQKEFVADAGTETTTFTLSFVSAKEYVLETASVLPPHPAMYMNADGTVDTLPGHSSERTEKGTYTVRRGIIVLTTDGGLTHTLRQVSDTLESPDLSYRPVVFTRETAE